MKLIEDCENHKEGYEQDVVNDPFQQEINQEKEESHQDGDQSQQDWDPSDDDSDCVTKYNTRN